MEGRDEGKVGRKKKGERRGEDGERGNERGGGRNRREERLKERQRKTVFPLKDATHRHNRPHSISLRRKMTEKKETNKRKGVLIRL